MEVGDSGEGELPYRNDRGAGWKMLKNTIKGTRISFDGCGSNGFLSLRGTNSKRSCHISSAISGTFSIGFDTIEKQPKRTQLSAPD